MRCDCRKGATCADCLDEADLTLASRVVDARLSQDETTELEGMIDAGAPASESLAAILAAREKKGWVVYLYDANGMLHPATVSADEEALAAVRDLMGAGAVRIEIQRSSA